MTLKDTILADSKQNDKYPLSPWFDKNLDILIENGYFRTPEQLDQLTTDTINSVMCYSLNNNIKDVVIGISGGIDSALTARIFQKAGWRVHCYLLPIHQKVDENDRGVELCKAFNLPYTVIDLSDMYDAMAAKLQLIDPKMAAIQKGNIRARLRMITLYNQASAFNGLVASTDNFSELGAGFWTLHGDVGDLAPIQDWLKSWDVQYVSSQVGVPMATIKATPTDGLGISNSDEDQLGVSYLEWDIIVGMAVNGILTNMDATPDDITKTNVVMQRLNRTIFKRSGNTIQKINIEKLEAFDNRNRRK